MAEVTLSILDVGHGNSAVLVDNDTTVVIDAGPGTCLLEFLDQEKIKKIDALLISHSDGDHIRGVISLLESQIAISLVRLNTDSEKTSDLWDDLTYELDQARQKGDLQFEIGLSNSDTGRFNTNHVHLEILAPSPYLAAKGAGSTDRLGRRLTSNSVSAVIRLSKGGKHRVLLPGDIDGTGLANMLECQADVSARVAVFPHHGGSPGKDDESGAFAEKFCEAVKPETVIFSIGRGSHGTPRKGVIKSIRNIFPETRIACTQLSEHCAVELPAKDFSHLTSRFAKGKERGMCCAGTIVIEFDKVEAVIQPDEIMHKAFIKKAAPNSLCLSDKNL